MLNERVLLTLGVRRQGVEANNNSSNVGALTSSYGKSATTPVVGLVIGQVQGGGTQTNFVNNDNYSLHRP